MKYVLGSSFLILFLAFSTPVAEAASLNTIERQVLLKQIEVLQAEVIRLQQLLGGGGAYRTQVVDDVYPSRFYDGPYEALYFVEGDDLYRRHGNGVRYGDGLLWDTFVNLVGSSFIRDNLAEFRIFNDDENLLTGYVEQRTDGEWILAINRFGDSLVEDHDSEFMIELLIHESTHIVFFNDLVYETDFIAEFWDTGLMRSHSRDLERADDFIERNEIGDDFYNDYPQLFVSDYAASDPIEDVVESFVYFVLNDRPRGNSVRDQKVRFFYDYPTLLQWRDEIRDQL